jgi:hypothetical protein
VLRLPAGKFTVREREMLMGTGILPPEFFQVARNPFFVGIGGRKDALLHPCMHASASPASASTM